MTSPQHPNESQVDEILRNYFQSVVHEAVEQSPEGIVVFAERSARVRAETTEAIAGLLKQERLRGNIESAELIGGADEYVDELTQQLKDLEATKEAL